MNDIFLTREELLRWRPRYGHKYYTFRVDDMTGTVVVDEAVWHDSIVDISLLKAGWVFDRYTDAHLALPASDKRCCCI